MVLGIGISLSEYSSTSTIRALLQMDSGAEETEETPEEKTHRYLILLITNLISHTKNDYRRAIEQEKSVYKESLERLRTVKPEIDHIKKVSAI